MVDTLTDWLGSTALSRAFLDHAQWAWPLSESLHFIGLCMLIGSIGVIDLRMLGLGKGIRFADLHKLVYFAVAGFIINVCTGSLFLSGTPDQYLLNKAFHFKLFFLTVAGLNVAYFYSKAFREMQVLGPEDEAPVKARVMAAVSLLCWVGVVCAGRMLTFFRP